MCNTSSISGTVTKCLKMFFFFKKMGLTFELYMVIKRVSFNCTCNISKQCAYKKFPKKRRHFIMLCKTRFHRLRYTQWWKKQVLIKYSVVGWPIRSGSREQQLLSDVHSTWREGEAFVKTKQWNITFFWLFPQLSHSKAQINKHTPSHNPAGRCYIAAFCVNSLLLVGCYKSIITIIIKRSKGTCRVSADTYTNF